MPTTKYSYNPRRNPKPFSPPMLPRLPALSSRVFLRGRSFHQPRRCTSDRRYALLTTPPDSHDGIRACTSRLFPSTRCAYNPPSIYRTRHPNPGTSPYTPSSDLAFVPLSLSLSLSPRYRRLSDYELCGFEGVDMGEVA